MGETEPKGQNLLTLRIIWGSLLMSIAIYGVIAAGLAKTTTAVARGADPIILVLYAVALLMALMAIFVPRAALRRSAHRAPVAPSDPSATGVPPHVFTALIIRWAMLEAVAILGLVLALITADPRAFIPLGVVSLAGMFLSYPGEGVAARV